MKKLISILLVVAMGMCNLTGACCFAERTSTTETYDAVQALYNSDPRIKRPSKFSKFKNVIYAGLAALLLATVGILGKLSLNKIMVNQNNSEDLGSTENLSSVGNPDNPDNPENPGNPEDSNNTVIPTIKPSEPIQDAKAEPLINSISKETRLISLEDLKTNFSLINDNVNETVEDNVTIPLPTPTPTPIPTLTPEPTLEPTQFENSKEEQTLETQEEALEKLLNANQVKRNTVHLKLDLEEQEEQKNTNFLSKLASKITWPGVGALAGGGLLFLVTCMCRICKVNKERENKFINGFKNAGAGVLGFGNKPNNLNTGNPNDNFNFGTPTDYQNIDNPDNLNSEEPLSSSPFYGCNTEKEENDNEEESSAEANFLISEKSSNSLFFSEKDDETKAKDKDEELKASSKNKNLSQNKLLNFDYSDTDQYFSNEAEEDSNLLVPYFEEEELNSKIFSQQKSAEKSVFNSNEEEQALEIKQKPSNLLSKEEEENENECSHSENLLYTTINSSETVGNLSNLIGQNVIRGFENQINTINGISVIGHNWVTSNLLILELENQTKIRLIFEDGVLKHILQGISNTKENCPISEKRQASSQNSDNSDYKYEEDKIEYLNPSELFFTMGNGLMSGELNLNDQIGSTFPSMLNWLKTINGKKVTSINAENDGKKIVIHTENGDIILYCDEFPYLKSIESHFKKS